MLMIALISCLCLVATTVGLQCRTLEGDSCIFPFSYKGVTYQSCTKTDSVLAWCATEVTSSGKVVNKKWGDCKECGGAPGDELNPRECRTKRNTPCVFPFTYKGEVHNQCTQADSENDAFWCATKVDSRGQVVRNNWGDCQSQCASECVRWEEASNGEVPPQAYTGGQAGIQGRAGLAEYVVRAQHEGGIYPGTFLAGLGGVDIPWRDQAISKTHYQVLVENSIHNCELAWLDEGQKSFNEEEIFNRALVIGGHEGNGSLTATYICKVNDFNKLSASFGGAIGKYNREEETCYLPVGDKVYPFSGYGIQLLANVKDLQLVRQNDGGDPPAHLSAVAGTSTFLNPGRSCSNESPCQRTNEAGQTFCCEATLRNRFPSCRIVQNCQRLPSDPVKQGTDGTCITISGASVNQPCVLPFKYKGVEYHSCTYEDSENQKAWCSTEVDSRGEHVGGQGKWGDCGPSCPIPR